jgi:predicted RNA-binding Zn ribbon-like protein
MQIQAHTFRPEDLVGGPIVLDLANTVTARNADPVDWLDGYPRLLEWAKLTGELDRGALARLGELSAADPRAAARALGRVRKLREAVHDLVGATVRGDAAPRDALSRLEEDWKQAVEHAHLAAEDRARPLLSVESSGLDYLRHELALRAVDLLPELPLERTRVCAGPQCGWLFLDRSKGGRRRWCDMATCGNAEKARRHYARTRAASSSSTAAGSRPRAASST